jgi:hypothetical protein
MGNHHSQEIKTFSSQPRVWNLLGRCFTTWALTLVLFALVIILDSILHFCLGGSLGLPFSYLCLLHIWHFLDSSPCPACLLKWGPTNFLHWLDLNHDPSDLCFLSSWDYISPLVSKIKVVISIFKRIHRVGQGLKLMFHLLNLMEEVTRSKSIFKLSQIVSGKSTTNLLLLLPLSIAIT